MYIYIYLVQSLNINLPKLSQSLRYKMKGNYLTNIATHTAQVFETLPKFIQNHMKIKTYSANLTLSICNIWKISETAETGFCDMNDQFELFIKHICKYMFRISYTHKSDTKNHPHLTKCSYSLWQITIKKHLHRRIYAGSTSKCGKYKILWSDETVEGSKHSG